MGMCSGKTHRHHKNSAALDPRWQKKERKTTNVMEKNSIKLNESHAALLGFTD